jgi:hypothetical protein
VRQDLTSAGSYRKPSLAILLLLEAHKLGEHARDISGCEDNLNEAVAAVSVCCSGRLER